MTDVTSFQRKRRELREQTSAAARLNEKGQSDPYAKSDANYDAVGVKDTGTEHQAGDPPPYSLTSHRPEELHSASKLHDPEDPASYEAEEDEGERQQAEGGPLTSVELREDEKPKEHDTELAGEFYTFEDQREYDALDKREAPIADASLENVDLAEPTFDEDEFEGKSKAELSELAGDRDIKGRSSMTRAQLLSALRG